LKPIPPVVPKGDGYLPSRVPPQKKSSNGEAQCAAIEIAACLDEIKDGKFTIDSKRLKVFVREAVYPGDPKATETIENKWVYAIRGETIEAEAHAVNASEWKVGYDFTPSSKPAYRTTTKGYIALERKTDYSFFISPFKLPPKTLTSLVSQCSAVVSELITKINPKLAAYASDSPVVKKSFSGTIGVVGVPDPYRWARDAHRLYYLPSLDAYLNYVYNNERTAKVFIASVLKSWTPDKIGSDDMGGKPDGKPEQYLKLYEQKKESLRQAFEVAMAYVCFCIQCPEHAIVEDAADERKGDALAESLFQFAAIAFRTNESATGRALLKDLLVDSKRLPAKYVLTENLPPPKGFDWEQKRGAWLAAVAILSEFIPTAVGEFKEAVWDKHLVYKYLSNTGNPAVIGYEVKLWRNVKTGKDLDYGFNRPWGREQYQEACKRLVRHVEEEGFAKNVAAGAEALKTAHKAYGPWVNALKGTAGLVIEIFNLARAFHEYREGGKTNPTGVIQSLGDLSNQFLWTVGALRGKSVAAKLVGMSGALGIVGGVCDVISFHNSAVAALKAHDYDAMRAYSVGVLGATGVVVGSAFLIVSQIWASVGWAGPVGTLVATIGSVLVLVGSAVATCLIDSYYEAYAKHCCFGIELGIALAWAPEFSRKRTAVEESMVLRRLLSAFGASRYEGKGFTQIKITPGWAPSGTLFEIWYQATWAETRTCDGSACPIYPFNHAPHKLSAIPHKGVPIAFEDDDFKLLAPDDEVSLIAQSVVASVSAVTSYLTTPVSNPSARTVKEIRIKHSLLDMSTHSVYIRLRVDSEGKEWTPIPGCFLKLAPGMAQTVSSMDEKNWVYTSNLSPYKPT